MNKQREGFYNLKIHYIWTFFSSFLFLAPIITLYYQYRGLDIHQILLLSALYFFFSVILEIPTSLIGDSLPRRYILRASVISNLFSFIIYAFFPSVVMFYLAVFFSALSQSLWS
jgi:MFS family permease